MRLLEEIEFFGGKRIVIVGDLVADQFVSGTISRVSREAPVFILRHDETETKAGGAANAAVNVASLGGEAVLIGLTGDDDNGHLLLETLERSGVHCENIQKVSGLRTTTKVRVLAGQQYAARQQVIRIDYENSLEIDALVRETLISNLNSSCESANAIVISDYGYGVVTPELFEAAKLAASSRKIPLILDSRFRLSEFRGATSATPNQDEVEQILGKDFSETDCEQLREKLGLASLLVTRGNKGMMLIEDGGKVFGIDAVGSKEPVDVTGAGDTVIAAYALGLASGLSFADAANIANHAGSIVVMKKGTASVSRDELIQSLTDRDVDPLTDSAAH